MKKALAVMVTCVVIVVSSAAADIPKLINYQGMLTDDAGEPLDGVFDILFRIYNAESGGDKRWEENHPAVSVDQGLFNVILGSESGGMNLDFSEEYWLEVVVAGEDMPRIRFTSVGYAYRAGVADSAIVAVSAPTGGGWTDDGSIVRLIDNLDSVGIGTSSPTHRLEVSCTQHLSKALRVGNDSSWFQVLTGGNTRLGLGDGHGNEAGIIFTTESDLGENVIGMSGCADGGSCASLLVCSENGRVGIGTTRPVTRLDIHAPPNNPAVARVNQTGGLNRAGWRVDRDSTEKWFVGLGSTNENLLFRRNGSSSDLVIDTSGNVGIGTSNPDEEMEIYKDQNYWTNLRFNNPNDGFNAGCAIEFYEGVNQRAYIARASSGNTTANPGPNSLCIQNQGPIEIDTWSADPVSILPFGGNVGIGTRDAERILHIKGDNPRILIEAATSNPEVNFEHSEDMESEIWSLYKHGTSDDLRFFQNGADRLTIQDATGNVGVGATDPGQKLDVNGIVRIRSWGLTHTHDVQVNADGDLCKVSSSRRYKKNIRELESHPDKILTLEPVSFEWKTTSEKSVGLIAEDVDQLIPELVGYDKEGRPDAVRYELLSLYVLEVVKKQAQAMKELKAENDELKQRIEVLERE